MISVKSHTIIMIKKAIILAIVLNVQKTSYSIGNFYIGD